MADTNLGLGGGKAPAGQEYNAQGVLQPISTAPQNTTPIINSTVLSPQTSATYTTPNPAPAPSLPDISSDTLTPTGQQANDLGSYIQNLNNSLLGKSEYAASQENAQGLPELQQSQNDLTSQLLGLVHQQKDLQNQQNTIPSQLQQAATGRGITAGGLAPFTSAALRNNQLQQAAIASQGLTVSAGLDAINGRIATAQQKINRAVSIKYDPIQEKIDVATKNLDIILKSPQYSLEEKNRAQKQIDLQKQKQDKLDQMKTDATTIHSWYLTALQNGAPQLQAQQLMKIATSDNPDLNAAFQLYAPYAKDPNAKQKALLDLEQQRAQIGNIKANTFKSYADIQKIKADAAAALAADAAVNPDVLQGMLNVYKSTGVLPSFGLSAKSPLRAQFYAALGSPDGQQIISDANTNKSVRAGLSTAYKTQQDLLSANQTAIGTLDQQLTLAKQYSDQVSRSNSPLVNSYVLGLKTGVFGDPQAAAFNNIVKTAAYEFAKILSGSAASISGVTISSASDAESMLNTSMTKGQFNEVLGLMQKEAQFRLQSQKDTLNQLQKDMNNVGSLTADLQNNTTKSGAPFDYKGAKGAGYTDEEIQAYLKSH